MSAITVSICGPWLVKTPTQLVTRPNFPVMFSRATSGALSPALNSQGCEGNCATVQSQEVSVSRIEAFVDDVFVTQKVKGTSLPMPSTLACFNVESQTNGFCGGAVGTSAFVDDSPSGTAFTRQMIASPASTAPPCNVLSHNFIVCHHAEVFVLQIMAMKQVTAGVTFETRRHHDLSAGWRH